MDELGDLETPFPDPCEDDGEHFIPIRDMDAWAEFWAINAGVWPHDESTCRALAMNCGLTYGGGAEARFRIGFVDEPEPDHPA